MSALLAGNFVNWPKLIQGRDRWRCPLCERTWPREGGAQGFVKAGARRHVSACWEKKLLAHGLKMGAWSNRQQGHILLTANAVYPTSESHQAPD